jgi:hypothetical protein
LINETDIRAPSIEGFGFGLPTVWSGESIALHASACKAFVFVGSGEVQLSETSRHTIYLYGAKYSLGGAMVGSVSRDIGDLGYFVEFYAAYADADGELSGCRLAQTRSVVFSDFPESRDYVPARSVKDKISLSVSNPPVWKESEANWPTVDGQPMRYSFQCDMLDTPTNRQFLTWNERVFLFFGNSVDGIRIKAVTQQIRFQTAQEHYADERRRAKKKSEQGGP